MSATLSVKQAARILAIVGAVSAPAPKIKTAFLSVTGKSLKDAGLGVDDIRGAMQSAQDMGIEVEDETPAREEAPKAAAKPAKETPARKPAAAAKAAPEPKERAPRVKAEPVEIEPGSKEAKAILRERQAADPERWGRVKDIVEFTPSGKPSRVVIRCLDPETGETLPDRRDGSNLREIKVQDLFQVRYTVEGTKRARALARIARREAAKAPAPKSTRAARPARRAKA